MKASTPLKQICASLFALTLMAACATPPPNPAPVPATVQQVAPATVIDVGQGVHKTPASFRLAINTSDGGDFSIKANSSGTTNAVAADISSFDVYLIDSAAAPSGAITSAFGPFNVSANLSGGQQTIVFNNVTTSTNDYYIAVKAKNAGGRPHLYGQQHLTIGRGSDLAGCLGCHH